MSVCHVTDIMGLVPKTLEYDKMLNAYNACLEAGVEIPKEVTAFLILIIIEEVINLPQTEWKSI